jgi:hypothetical protein
VLIRGGTGGNCGARLHGSKCFHRLHLKSASSEEGIVHGWARSWCARESDEALGGGACIREKVLDSSTPCPAVACRYQGRNKSWGIRLEPYAAC